MTYYDTEFDINFLPSMLREDNDSDLKLTADVTISLYILFRFIQHFQIASSPFLGRSPYASPHPVSPLAFRFPHSGFAFPITVVDSRKR